MLLKNLRHLTKFTSVFYDSIILFLASSCIRLIYIQNRYWVAGDTPDYLDIAKNLAFHHAFAFTNANGSLQYTALRPPLYPFLIALFWTGPEPPIKILLLCQVLIGSITVVLIYLMTVKQFNRLIAIVSASLLVISPLTIHYTASVMTETLFTFLVVFGCYLWGEQKNFLSGFFFGLASLTRPIIFPFLVLVFFISLLSKLRFRWRGYLTIVLTAFIVASPWIVRNTLLFNRLTLTQSSGYGTNLLYGSIEIPLWGDDVWSWILKDPLTQPVPGLDEIELDRFRMKIAVSRISNNPLGWLKARVKQYPRLFLDSGDYILGDYSASFGQAIKDSNFLVLFVKLFFIFSSLMLFLLFWTGIFIFRGKILNLLHIFLFPLFVILMHLPMWIELRYNLAALPFIYIVAAIGLVGLTRKAKYYFRK